MDLMAAVVLIAFASLVAAMTGGIDAGRLVAVAGLAVLLLARGLLARTVGVRDRRADKADRSSSPSSCSSNPGIRAASSRDVRSCRTPRTQHSLALTDVQARALSVRPRLMPALSQMRPTKKML